MKYVVISAVKTSKKPEGETSVIRYPIIFPNNFVHSHVAKVFSLLISFMHLSSEITVTSAGELNSADFNGDCYGKSDTLNCKSIPTDTELVRMNDYGAGMVEL